MTTSTTQPTTTTTPGGASQRESLENSERDANAKQPENYKDTETAEKIVEIPPVPKDDAPIKSLDPK